MPYLFGYRRDVPMEQKNIKTGILNNEIDLFSNKQTT